VVPESVLLVRSGTGVPPVDLTWHGRPAHVLVDLCIKGWRHADVGIRPRTYDQEHLGKLELRRPRRGIRVRRGEVTASP
jgi:hypothetical protein